MALLSGAKTVCPWYHGTQVHSGCWWELTVDTLPRGGSAYMCIVITLWPSNPLEGMIQQASWGSLQCSEPLLLCLETTPAGASYRNPTLGAQSNITHLLTARRRFRSWYGKICMRANIKGEKSEVRNCVFRVRLFCRTGYGNKSLFVCVCVKKHWKGP